MNDRNEIGDAEQVEEKPAAFFECLIPATACNMRCSYCFVMQQERRQDHIPDLPYEIDEIKRALTKQRLGGVCFFSLCGAGETLLPSYTLPIAKALLENGHFINITNNGTCTKRFDEIEETWSYDELSRTLFSFSFHYLELKRLNKVNVFFDNVKRMHSAGASIMVQFNLCDEYLPYLEEMRSLCITEVGAMPHVALTRDESAFPATHVKVLTSLSVDEYISIGDTFKSSLFDVTCRQFNNKQREFCYAGDWTFELNFGSARLHRCYYSAYVQDIIKNPEKPIKKIAVGNHCGSPYCMNSSHFMSLGVVPSVDLPSYADLRDRPGAQWFKPRMKAFLSHKLSDSNRQYPIRKQIQSNMFSIVDNALYSGYSFLVRQKMISK